MSLNNSFTYTLSPHTKRPIGGFQPYRLTARPIDESLISAATLSAAISGTGGPDFIISLPVPLAIGATRGKLSSFYQIDLRDLTKFKHSEFDML
jgi:hypothetical protein